MPKFGGFSPYPRRLGGGRPRDQDVFDSLIADRGSAFAAAAENSDSVVYIETLALARAISAAWGTNERLGNIWNARRMPAEVIPRWEKILAVAPLPSDTEAVRRARIRPRFERFGQATIHGYLHTVLSEELGDAFVGLEYVPYSSAVILVPDGTYPWGMTGTSPWSSTIARVLVRMQKPAGWTEGQFYGAAGKAALFLEPVLPAWTTYDWYRAGAVSTAIPNGPTAAGFYLDEDFNLDNQILDE